MKTSTYDYERKVTGTGKIYAKDIPQDLRDEIIRYWKTSKINSSPVLAERFGFSVHLINTILDNHLKSKKHG